MKAQNLFIVNNGNKTLFAENVIAIQSSDTVIIVPMEYWNHYKRTSSYTDADVTYCLEHGLVPGQLCIEGNNFTFEEYVK